MTKPTLRERRLGQCQRAIHYYFKDPSLLDTALTHSSLRAPDRECNERLEFLGDSVLGMVITEELYRRLPQESEGDLTRIKSATVSRASLHDAAERLKLADVMEIARGVGRRDALPASVLANVFESVIGAIYLDGGYYPAREFVLKHLGPELENEIVDRGASNYKSHLQQMVQQLSGFAPSYRTLEEDGPDHDKTFVVAARFEGREWGRASGTTKKEAQQEAARLALDAYRAEHIEDDDEQDTRKPRRRRSRRRRRSDDDETPHRTEPHEAEAPVEEVESVQATDEIEVRSPRRRTRKPRDVEAAPIPYSDAPRTPRKRRKRMTAAERAKAEKHPPVEPLVTPDDDVPDAIEKKPARRTQTSRESTPPPSSSHRADATTTARDETEPMIDATDGNAPESTRNEPVDDFGAGIDLDDVPAKTRPAKKKRAKRAKKAKKRKAKAAKKRARRTATSRKKQASTSSSSKAVPAKKAKADPAPKPADDDGFGAGIL